VNYYQFHLGDYISNTVHLSPLEDLAYRRLLDLYYQTEKPISTETQLVARRLRLGCDEIKIVLKEFFELTEDGWRNARCDEEIERYQSKANTARANGKKGGRPQKNPAKTQSVNLANQEKTESKANQEPRTINQEPIKEKTKAKKPDEQFLALWRMYGLRGVRKKAWEQWQKLNESEKDQVAASIPDFIKEWPDLNYRVYFERYIRDGVFEGVLERKASGQLNIPKNTNGKSYGQPQQKMIEMPTDAEYAMSENVKRDANGDVIFD